MIVETLKQWESLSRYPELLTLVADKNPRSSVDKELAVRALLHGIAAAHEPRTAVEQLIKAGEFRAADDLLTNMASTAKASEDELAEMERQVADARQRGLDEILVRKFELETRGSRVNAKMAFPADLAEAFDRLEDARESLTLFEYDIQAAEERRQKELRERLAAFLEEQRPSPERDALEQAVRRCIDRCNFLTAENLLAKRTRVGDISDPALVPQRPVWPYMDGAHNGVRRFLRGGNWVREFAHDWGPRSQDQESAIDLLTKLDICATRWGTMTPDDVGSFLTSLDVFLGGEHRERYVRPWKNGFSSALYSISDPRVPRFQMCDGEVPIWFPTRPHEQIPDDLLKKSLLIAFHPDKEIKEENVLSFTASLLFRLVGDSNRRVNFTRWLSRQIKLPDAMPLTFAPPRLDENQTEGTRNYILWFFDYHLMVPEADSVIELINFYSARNPHLLCGLLREICLRSEGLVSARHVHAAWNSKRFQETAMFHLLGAVRNDPWSLAALACVYLVADEGEEISATVVNDWLQAYDAGDGRSVSLAFDILIDNSLLERGNAPDSAWFPPSSTVRVLKKQMGDLEKYIREKIHAANQ